VRKKSDDMFFDDAKRLENDGSRSELESEKQKKKINIFFCQKSEMTVELSQIFCRLFSPPSFHTLGKLENGICPDNLLKSHSCMYEGTYICICKYNKRRRESHMF
jgi:hypothetical protein